MLSHVIASLIGAYLAIGGMFALAGYLADSFDQALFSKTSRFSALHLIGCVFAWPAYLIHEWINTR